MRRLARLLALACAAAVAPAEAMPQPPELRGLVEAARPAGCSDYSVLIWDLYRAELWSDADRLPGATYGLSLTYRTEFTRRELVESSVDEMVRLSGRPATTFAVARGEMAEAFRDVAPGDRITAWRAAPDRLRVFVNGRETGGLSADVDLFLAIWLGEGTRNPDGRREMLAGRCDG